MWIVTIMVIITFCLIILGVLGSIHTNTEVAGEWKEILLLLLGAFIGSYGKIIDYWFGGKETNNYDNKENNE
jgi:hypothetical protein